MDAENDIARHNRRYLAAFAGSLKRAGALAIGPLLAGIVAFLAAGRIDWAWPWIYVGINLVNVLAVCLLTIRIDPKTAAGRSKARSTRKWDDIGSVFYLLAMYIVLPLVAGLDERFAWTRDDDITWHVAGAAVCAAGLALTAWAAAANTYMWSEVIIQRGQTVCSAGPYQFVRHPAYAGLTIQALGVPSLLGSLWALIPSIMVAVLMIIETALEDRMLQAALPGYRDYVRKVRFRLVPGIW